MIKLWTTEQNYEYLCRRKAVYSEIKLKKVAWNKVQIVYKKCFFLNENDYNCIHLNTSRRLDDGSVRLLPVRRLGSPGQGSIVERKL